jgi:Ino eighty subunit 1
MSPEPSPAAALQRSHSGSTIADPDLDRDDEPTAFLSSPRHAGAGDPRNSLRHLLVDDPTTNTREGRRERPPTMTVTPPVKKTKWIRQNLSRDDTEDEEPPPSAPIFINTPEIEVRQFAPGNSGRKNAHSGTTSSIYGGNKMKNIKKEDGIPLWRSDIQYEFLRAVFEDDKPVFTNIITKESGLTFADIYIDAMARSTKTSKILRDKLLSDRPSAVNMAMVCLLVNVGRMNTTLNCESPSSI